jgi:hypothetical protein
MCAEPVRSSPAGERVAGVGPAAAGQVVITIRLDEADGGPPLVAVPRAQFAALRIDMPDEQAAAGQVPVGADALAVLEQQVVARVAIETVHRPAALDRLHRRHGGIGLLDP